MLTAEAIDDQMRTLLRRWAAYAQNAKRDKAMDELFAQTRLLLGDISAEITSKD